MSKSMDKNSKRKISRFLSSWGAVLSMIIAFAIFSILQPEFFCSWSNFESILRAASITVVISMGMTFAFSCGVFDLSVGAVATLGAAFSLTFMVWYGMPMWIAIIMTCVACMLVGVLNSILVLKFKIPAILATLAMQFILSGTALTYSGGSVISPTIAGAKGQPIVMQVPDLFWKLGKAPWIYIIMIVLVLFVAFFQNKTKHGRYLYMVGANPEAAKLTGINVNAYRTFAFVATGFFAAIGGALIVSRAGTVAASAGDSYLMPSIAAVNIGISVAGIGKPNAIGTLIGALLLQVVENGLFMLSVPYYSINIAKGLILVLALVLSNLGQESK
ncbi:MAG: ABC transporter permease [Lachnospiraceae bacterium]|nr:ABC transporter permease [Lachnospiraceae bacterium]